jgi:hypothetical protein
MRSKRQQTMAKIAREQLVRERRTKKRERKQAAAAERNAKANGSTIPADNVDGAANAADADAVPSPATPARGSEPSPNAPGV